MNCEEELEEIRASRRLVGIQGALGFFANLLIAVPYLRAVHGLERLNPQQRYLFVSNHVSLLDTVLLGALFWRSDCYPILVLGDRKVWHASAFHKLLSSPIGFLLDRRKMNCCRIRDLKTFGRSARNFNLVVFPEGTRGNGVDVAECQPGIFYAAQEARVPMVPVFIENMQMVSSKEGRFRPMGGLRKVEVHFGEPLQPEHYLGLEREELTAFVRQKLTALRPSPRLEHSSLVPQQE